MIGRAAKFALACVLGAGLGDSPADAKTVTETEFGRLDAEGIPSTMDGIPVRSTGTGFYISTAGYFVTAFHVAANCERRAILRPDGAFAAMVAALSPEADIAVLKSAPPSVAAELTPGAELAKGTSFQIVRYWHMGGLKSRSSIVARNIGGVEVPGRPQISFAVRADERVVGGNSGSPLMLMNGGVAGLVDAVAYAQPTLALIIDSRTIAHVLTEAAVSFRWRDDAIPASHKAGEAAQFTFPIACYLDS